MLSGRLFLAAGDFGADLFGVEVLHGRDPHVKADEVHPGEAGLALFGTREH